MSLLNKLLQGLQKIDASDRIVQEYLTEDSETEILSSYATELLVTINGKCNWNNHDILKRNGYSVFAGEQDSFGWLSGCITTKKGILVFF